MNDLIQSSVLGILQGIGEFLPISSTAHLVIIPYFFQWKDPGLAFDVALHFGTLIAVVAFFWRDWIKIFELAFKNEVQNPKSKVQIYEKNTLLILIFATVPGVLAGYFLEEKAETIFRDPLLIAVSLSLMGLVLYLSDWFSKKNLSVQDIGWGKAIIIGIAQAVAIIPGVSRSGVTISAALSLGINRKDAARFSFLLATPIIFGASIAKFPEIIHIGINFSTIVGVIFSAISGYLSIKYLVRFIEKVGYLPFFIYRLIMALIIIASYFITGS
jgi:undecaprenyl-diphosphatase